MKVDLSKVDLSKADFSGYATKAGLRCSDGRTIMPDAFAHQDAYQVPLVWSHSHADPENVLGHAILEARPDGMYTYAFFNDTAKGQHARSLVEHRDINMLSIWANALVERAKNVMHGMIREVSLVLSGANPGALIESVAVRHGDYEEDLNDEVIIYTGLSFEHSDSDTKDTMDTKEDTETVQDIYDSMNDDQKELLHFMLGEALEDGDTVSHAKDDDDDDDDDGETIKDVYESMNEQQKQVLHYMLGEALESKKEAKHDGMDADNTDDTDDTDEDLQEGTEMKHNVFEDQSKDSTTAPVISHDDMQKIVATAERTGSLKHAVEEYALSHGINDIEVLFPDAKAVSNVPEWVARRSEWVSTLLSATRKSPFSRIKTLSADLTFEAARAKGYIKGTLKREEFFGVAARTTTPTTIYKKQALDRDDILDITDFDVIAWLKAEMRLMLDEELGRAILIGDGRDVADVDKINEGHIRPIATDHELYTTQVTVNVDDTNASMFNVIDQVILNRSQLKGTGQPNFYTTEYWIARFLTLRDGDGHRMYKTLADLAAELRVAQVIAVEVMLDEPDIIGVLVNPVDYVLGADKGGSVTMFDDFDIDYNKEKYLIETRVSGALVKVKSAMVLRRNTAPAVEVEPLAPTFNAATGELNIPTVTGVIYTNDADTVIDAAGSPYTVASGDTYIVYAVPATGYVFDAGATDMWSFTAD